MKPDAAIAGLIVSTATASPRATSEDRLLVERVPSGLLIVIADGAGGMGGGARAAEMLVERVRATILQVPPGSATPGTVSAALHDADRAINADPAAGETTAVALLVADAGIMGASAGDSEAWVVHAGGYEVLTASQSRRRLGSGLAQPVPFAHSFARGVLIAGTDGLFAYAKPELICGAMQSGPRETTATRLVDLVRLAGGRLPDDTTVVSVVLSPQSRSK